SVLLFFLLVQNWWTGAPAIEQNNNTFVFFISSLLAPICFSLLIDFVLPQEATETEKPPEDQRFFRGSHQLFYSILIILMLLFIIRGFIKDDTDTLPHATAIRVLAIFAFAYGMWTT